MSPTLAERYSDKIAGALSCYEREVIIGTLPRDALRRGDETLSRHPRDPDLRLPGVRGAAARSHPPQGSGAGGAGQDHDRALLEHISARKTW